MILAALFLSTVLAHHQQQQHRHYRSFDTSGETNRESAVGMLYDLVSTGGCLNKPYTTYTGQSVQSCYNKCVEDNCTFFSMTSRHPGKCWTSTAGSFDPLCFWKENVYENSGNLMGEGETADETRLGFGDDASDETEEAVARQLWIPSSTNNIESAVGVFACTTNDDCKPGLGTTTDNRSVYKRGGMTCYNNYCASFAEEAVARQPNSEIKRASGAEIAIAKKSELEKEFDEVDTNGNGALTRAELGVKFGRMFGNDDDIDIDASVDAVFTGMDDDHSSTIDFAEYKRLATAPNESAVGSKSPEQIAELQQGFDYVDKNGNGALTRAELRSLFVDMFGMDPGVDIDASVNAVFKGVDTDSRPQKMEFDGVEFSGISPPTIDFAEYKTLATAPNAESLAFAETSPSWTATVTNVLAAFGLAVTAYGAFKHYVGK